MQLTEVWVIYFYFFLPNIKYCWWFAWPGYGIRTYAVFQRRKKIVASAVWEKVFLVKINFICRFKWKKTQQQWISKWYIEPLPWKQAIKKCKVAERLLCNETKSHQRDLCLLPLWKHTRVISAVMNSCLVPSSNKDTVKCRI